MNVWGNLSSGKLFCPGSRYYGLTKRGEILDSSYLGKPVGSESNPNKKFRVNARVWSASQKGGRCLG